MKIPKPRRPNVKSIEHDPKSLDLTVHFHSGRSYRYSGVPVRKARALTNAQSQGTFLHQHIVPHHDATELPPVADLGSATNRSISGHPDVIETN